MQHPIGALEGAAGDGALFGRELLLLGGVDPTGVDSCPCAWQSIYAKQR
jgi:hypothetical protein